MAPELHEPGNDSFRLEAEQDSTPEYVGAPTEYATEQEVPEAVGMLAQLLAGLGIGLPVLVSMAVLLGSCMICALVAVAAGWTLF